MKKLITCLFVATLAITVSAATYNEGFDVADNWSGGSMTGYNAKDYTDATGIGTFNTDDAVREGTATQAGAYAWRLDDDPNYWRYEAPADTGIVSFSVYTADWDVSDNNSFQIRYSTDSGSTWTALMTTNASYYTSSGLGDKDYKLYESGSLNITPGAGEQIYIEVANNQGDKERILIDTFSVVTIPEPFLLGILPLAFFFFRRK